MTFRFHLRFAACFLGLALLAGGCTGKSVAASTRRFHGQTGFVQRRITVDGSPTTIWVFIPPDYDGYRMYPAILFLHGLFEQGNGDGNANVLSAGLGPVIARAPQRWPFITIFPQSTGTWRGPERQRAALAALDDAEQNYLIDRERIILAGLSYGGLGVWEIGGRNPDRFAALVPVSGQRAPDELIPALASIPVWAFASEGDPFVHADNSVDTIRAIRSRGGRANLTEFKGADHDCWASAVDQPGFRQWLLQQRRDPLQATLSGYKMPGRLRAWNDR